MKTLKIDKVFRDALPVLTDEQHAELEQSILSDGCRDAIVVWNDTIVDGHNRYDICIRHSKEFRTVRREFPDREEALSWIDTNALARRNMTPIQLKLLRGRRFERMKKTYSDAGRAGASVTNNGRSKNCHGRTNEILAEQYQVSPGTIQHDARFARAVDQLKSHDPEIERHILSGDVKLKTRDVEPILKMTPRQQQRAVERLNSGKSIGGSANGKSSPKHHIALKSKIRTLHDEVKHPVTQWKSSLIRQIAEELLEMVSST